MMDNKENDTESGALAPAGYSYVSIKYPKAKSVKVGRKRSKSQPNGYGEERSGFTLRSVLQESHRISNYGVSFNPNLSDRDIFATCGDHFVTIYECVDCKEDPDYKFGMRPLFSYRDMQDCFYCCAWTHDTAGNPLVIAAGKSAIIRVIDINRGHEKKAYSGHGGAINDVKVSPADHRLVLSASKDQSIRLWNVDTDICVAIFGGVEGHRDEVVTIDFHPIHPLFVSGGIDHALLIWSLKKPDMQQAIQASHTFDSSVTKVAFPTVHEHFPVFITRDVHQNYIDSVQWFGDLLFSKSCENDLALWKPGGITDTLDSIMTSTTNRQPNEHEINVIVFRRFTLKHCGFWFIRFSINLKLGFLAYGNLKGEMFVYKLKVDSLSQITCHQLKSNSHCKSVIRQTAFNRDGTVLIAVTDNSFVLRYDFDCGEKKTNTSTDDEEPEDDDQHVE